MTVPVFVVHDVGSVGDRVLAFARNVGIRSPMDATSYNTRTGSTVTPLRKIRNSRVIRFSVTDVTVFFYFGTTLKTF